MRSPGEARRRAAAMSCAALLTALAACAATSPARPDGRSSRSEAPQSGGAAPAAPRTTTWGPTTAELSRARELVHGWSAEQLAGQVIVGRYQGTSPQTPADLVRRLHLAGMTMTSDNVSSTEQVRATTAAITEAVRADDRSIPPVIGVDQEGGYASHLDGVATEFPTFATDGEAVQAGHQRVVRRAAYAQALELRDLGFTWVYAPVADVTIGPADPVIGTRSASRDAGVAARTTALAIKGYAAAGLVSTAKHFPGHGSVTTDSHDAVPVQNATLAQLRARDLLPFVAAVKAGAPAVMVSHIDATAIAPGEPSSLAAPAYAFLRSELHFDGVAVTDSLGMGAVSGTNRPAVRALLAGADLLLMPADTATTHAGVTQAIRSGTVPRARAEDAAAKVVALQLWQRRVATEVPVPVDAAGRALDAATALREAAAD